jgi:hypothetical protein
MRWVNRMTCVLVACLGLGSSGCISSAVLQNGDPRSLVFLPLTLPLDFAALLAASAMKGSSSGSSGATVSYSAYDWKDPNDWVADCAGPVLCQEGARHRCTGSPGACQCDCVWFATETECPADWAAVSVEPTVASVPKQSVQRCN